MLTSSGHLSQRARCGNCCGIRPCILLTLPSSPAWKTERGRDDLDPGAGAWSARSPRSFCWWRLLGVVGLYRSLGAASPETLSRCCRWRATPTSVRHCSSSSTTRPRCCCCLTRGGVRDGHRQHLVHSRAHPAPCWPVAAKGFNLCWRRPWASSHLFCSCTGGALCSSSFVAGRRALGVTFSFLISAPMVNGGPWRCCSACSAGRSRCSMPDLGLAVAMRHGWVIGRLKLESQLEDCARACRTRSARRRSRAHGAAERVAAGLANVRDRRTRLALHPGGHRRRRRHPGQVPQDQPASIAGRLCGRCRWPCWSACPCTPMRPA